MRIVRAATAGTVLSLATVIAACSSDTVTAPSANSLAHSYDSLASALYAAGTPGDSMRAAAAAILNIPISYGAEPSPVSITASGTTQAWLGDAFQLVDSAGTQAFTVVALWPNASVSQFVFMESEDSTALSASEFLSDTILAYSDTSTVTTISTGESGRCTHVAVTNTVPSFVDTTAICSPIHVTVAAVLQFPATAGISAMFEHITISSQTVDGVRFQMTHG